MATKKSYDIEYGPTYWECRVVIDHDDLTALRIKAMVEFWMDWEYHLEMNDGDYTKTFLQQLAREINYIQIQENVNLKGVIEAFNSREGWVPMDGSCGIEITFVDDFKFEHEHYEVQEGVEV